MADQSTWTSGYVTDVGYTFGYYPELNPARVPLAFLNSGLRFPKIETACELGFGQGLSANLHSASSGVTWYGTDFNPSQASFARELEAACGSGAHLFDASFSEFCGREDLPDFDFVGLHGIWSWISDENRSVIVDFLRRKLKVGGVLYVSYNTFPGWAAFAPIRHLMVDHAETLGTEGRGIVPRIDQAIEFADRLLQTEPLFLKANPVIAERLSRLKDHNRHYLAHEYFNRDWHPMHFSTMARWLEGAKLQFACSAHFLDGLDMVNLTQAQQDLLAEIPDPLFKQSVRDFMVNQQFRKDYWVKGARTISTLDRIAQLRQLRFVLGTARASVGLKVTGALGEATLSASVYDPILDFLANGSPRTLAEIEKHVATDNITLGQIVQAISILVSTGSVFPAQSQTDTQSHKPICSLLNQKIMQGSQSSSDISFVASPLTGGGHLVGRFAQLFLLAFKEKKSSPQELAHFVWRILEQQGQRIIKEGKTLETPEENIAELVSQAETFKKDQLSSLQALQIA